MIVLSLLYPVKKKDQRIAYARLFFGPHLADAFF
jgi:hypothetical protein